MDGGDIIIEGSVAHLRDEVINALLHVLDGVVRIQVNFDVFNMLLSKEQIREDPGLRDLSSRNQEKTTYVNVYGPNSTNLGLALDFKTSSLLSMWNK